MMQSAAVLPTESPVKSLPEILGVPLQRKTFFTLIFVCFVINLEPVLQDAERTLSVCLIVTYRPMMCHAAYISTSS